VSFDSSGNFLTAFGTAGSGAGQFTQPGGVAVQPGTGDVFVIDAQNSRIERFRPDGTYTGVWGSAGSSAGQFSSPWGVAFAPDGSFFVTDSATDRVEKFGMPGSLVRFAIALRSSTAGSPQSVTVTAMDAAGDVISTYAGSPSWSDLSG